MTNRFQFSCADYKLDRVTHQQLSVGITLLLRHNGANVNTFNQDG
ncbi:hypothetical protein [Chamaesiphon sp.]